ncbi:MAG TPA: tetratricopeptide repeat protein, partial [Vicinamibacteria bacterium]|nr:tetratricopeptide repeat protein [Vicinamibacteria bacterium]
MWSRTVRWMVPVLLLAAVLPGCRWTKEGRRTRHLAQGEGYIKDKKFKEAIIEYKNVLKVDGKNPRAIRQLGIALFDAGAPGEAAGYLRRAAEADPADLEVRQRLATTSLLQGNPAKAREHAAFVVEKQPDNLDALSVLGQTATTPEEVDAVVKRLEDKNARFAEPDKVQRLLGALYARQHDLGKAEQAFVAAVAAKPDSVESHLALARLYVGKNDLAQAEKEFRKAADLAPPAAPARLQLAEFYVATKRPEDARRVLTEVVQKAPDAHSASLMLAELSFRDGKTEDALKWLEPVLKANPQDPAGLLLSSRLHLVKSETGKAVEAATYAVKARPQLAPAHQLLAVAHRQSGNVSLALNEAKEALRLAPEVPDVVLLTAELELESGAPQDAVQVLTRFIDKYPQYAPARE